MSRRCCAYLARSEALLSKPGDAVDADQLVAESVETSVRRVLRRPGAGFGEGEAAGS